MKEKFFLTIKSAFIKMGKDLWSIKYVVICVFIYTRLAKFFLGAMCPMVITTGLPCPGCGITRAMISVLLFRFSEALVYNPCIFVWIAYVLYLILYKYFMNKKIPYFIPITGVVFSVTICVYIYRMINCFPGEPPMTYMYRNVFGRMIPGYQSFIDKIYHLYN